MSAESEKHKGLGVGILVDKDLERHIGRVKKMNSNILAVYFYLKGLKLLVIIVYIPPNSENMAHEASELIQKKIKERQREFRIVLMENFNHIVNPAIDKQPSTKICKKLRLHTWLRSQNFIDTYRYWNQKSRKFT